MAPTTKLKQQTVHEAFCQARNELGNPRYRLKGKGYASRCTLLAHWSRPASQALQEGQQWEWVCEGYKNAGARRLFAVALVEKAAEILGVDYNELVTDKYKK